MPSAETETLFQAVSRGDWAAALESVYALRGDGDPLADRAREVLLEHLVAELSGETPRIADEQLERVLLLDRAKFLNVSKQTKDRIAEVLVVRNKHLPERAARFARYRPETDASRGVLAQYAVGGPSESVRLDATRVTWLEGATRIDGRRPVFRSRQERTLFAAARRRFNQCLLLPNAALHSVVSMDAIRGLLSASDREAFFRLLIDLVVVDPAQDYRAIWFLELDSPWHDTPAAERQDRLKDRLLTLAGCRLVRLRTDGEASLAEMVRILEAATATAPSIEASDT